MPLAGTNGPSFTDLIVPAIIVMFVDLLESTSIARAMAKLNGYELPYSKEIVALGICNFGGAAFNAYTTTGSFSRSSVSNTAGSKSPLSQFFCAWVVGFTLIFLTGFFANVPYNVLGAIIVVAVAQLVEYTVPFKLWKTNKLDLACWLAAFLAVLFISVEIGLAVAIGLAILITLYQTAFPHTAVLGKIGTASGSAIFRNIKQYPDSQLFPGILLFRIDAPVYFGNARSISDKIEKLIKRYNGWSAIQGLTDGIKFLVIDLTPVQYLDTMGIHLFEDLVFDTKKKGIQLLLANPNKAVVQDLEKVRFSELIGRENLFVSLHDAFQYAQQRLVELGYSANPVPIGRKGAPKDLEVDKQLLAADLPPIFPHGKATKRVVAEKDHITDA